MSRPTILFLQLPQASNDVAMGGENLPLAGVYLNHALDRSPESARYAGAFLPARVDTWDDRHIVAAALRRRPAVVAATLYLWNIERTLHILTRLRAALPELKVVVGGPEIARDHPFIFAHPAVDVVVSGEGETVFPDILRGFRTGEPADFDTVAWRHAGDFRWGSRIAGSFSLDALPPPGHRLLRPDRHGMAYIEASRGCPMHCSFCRYGQDRARTVYLSADEVLQRIDIQWRRGAREVRFIDPTFNSNPVFHEILEKLARWNRPRKVGFFVEMVGATVTDEDARLLADAGVVDVEIGMQSRDPETLQLIHRSPRLAKLDRGIERLVKAGLKVTVDLMYALPNQSLGHIESMLDWAAATQKGAHVQCMQTLLLPGTELRSQRDQFGMVGLPTPPYQVHRTNTLSADDIRRADAIMRERLDQAPDTPTERFVATKLRDVFEEEVRFDLPLPRLPPRIAGSQDRRAVVLAGDALFGHRDQIIELIRRAVTAEPFMLWQFILEPLREEPLDLLESITSALEQFPPLVSDQFIDIQAPGCRASRRLMIRLRPGRRYDRTWRDAAEEWLRAHYF